MAACDYLQGRSRSVPSVGETRVFVNLDLGPVREGGVEDAGGEIIGEQMEATGPQRAGLPAERSWEEPCPC